MKSINRWMLISLLAGFAVYASGEEAEKAAEVDQDPSESGPAGERPAGGKPTPEIFVPTEDISEDFAVSFPVDI